MNANGRRRAYWIIATTATATISLLGLHILESSGTKSGALINVGTFAAIATVILGVYSWHAVGGRMFSPYLVTFLSASCFHIGAYVLNALNLLEPEFGEVFYPFRFSEWTLLSAIKLTLISLAGLHIGALCALKPAGERFAVRSVSLNSALVVRFVGMSIVSISIIPACVYISDLVGHRIAGQYSNVITQDSAVGLANWKFWFAQALTPGCIYLLAGSKKAPLFVKGSFAILAIQGLALLAVGDRSGAITPLLGWIWVYHVIIKPISTRYAITAGATLLVLVPAVQLLRNLPVQQLTSWHALTSAIGEVKNPLVAFFTETGNTLVPLCDTIEMVPSERGHSLGTEFLQAHLGSFNFLFPVRVNGDYVDPPWWLTDSRYPELTPRIFGFTFIAEGYLEWGWIGLPILMAIYGVILARMDSDFSGNNGAIYLGIAGVVFCVLPHFTRGCMLELGRYVFRFCLLPYAEYLLLRVLLLRAGAVRSSASRANNRSCSSDS